MQYFLNEEITCLIIAYFGDFGKLWTYVIMVNLSLDGIGNLPEVKKVMQRLWWVEEWIWGGLFDYLWKMWYDYDRLYFRESTFIKECVKVGKKMHSAW